MKYIFTILIVSFVTLIMTGQVIEHTKQGYVYQDSIYDSKDLRSVMLHNKEALELYDRYIKNQRDKNILLNTGISITIVGSVIVSRIMHNLSSEPGSELGIAFITGIVTIIFGPPFILVGVLKPSKRYLKRSIDIYNESISLPNNTSYLEFRTTKSGIGLVYNF